MAENPERSATLLEEPPASERLRALVIVNPYATTVSDRLRNLVVAALSARYEVEAVDTQARGHAMDICREAAHEGYDVVIAFGGDGTVNEAINGLAGSDTPLTCLPGGSTNVYCRLLGIPGEIVDATEHLLRVADDWRPRKVDVASVNDRLFGFSAGLGLDAVVVERVDAHPRRKARYGQYYFIWCAVTSFVSRFVIAKPPALRLEAGGETVEGVTAVVQNAEHYTYYSGAPVDVVDGASLDGGTISAAVMRRAAARDLPSFMVRELTQRLQLADHRQIATFQSLDGFRVVSADERALPLQVDGAYVAAGPEAGFGVRPRALTVVS